MTDIIPISISEAAQKAIHAALSASNVGHAYGLRVGLKGGGCGATFLLGFDKASENDKVYLINNIQVFIDRRHLMYVIGNEIDYEQTEAGLGFTIVKK